MENRNIADEVLDFKTVYVESFGCSANQADGEVIMGCLEKAGYRVTENPSEAEILVYNTCAVKSPTENRIISLVKKTPPEKKIIITGCLPLISMNRLAREIRFDGIAGPSPGLKIVELLRKVELGENCIMLKNDFMPSPFLPRKPVSFPIKIVPVSYGCLGACTFCCVRSARGKLRSHSPVDLTQYVHDSIRKGFKEIWLTAQDIAAYGKDSGAGLAELVNKILRIDEKFFVRLGMMNPNSTGEILDDLIGIYKDERVFKFLHLPVQSGDDEVLRLMNRNYSVADFRKIVSRFRSEVPRLTLATDIICGFPGEAEEAFSNSLKLISEVKPDIVNTSKFYPRPGTDASKRKLISTLTVRERSGRMTAITSNISMERNSQWLPWKGEIFIDEKGLENTWIGRNYAYKPVVVESESNLLGRFIDVKTVGSFTRYLKGELAE